MEIVDVIEVCKNTRNRLNKEEKEFWDECYKIGMRNPWCSGRVEIESGNFIVEEDRLNRKSVCIADSEDILREFFEAGNWCLGQAIIYGDICFIQQVNGGDEWLTIKRFPDGNIDGFESISWRYIIKKDGVEGFKKVLDRLLAAKSVKEYFGD